MLTQPAHDLGASSQDSTIPITDSQILPLRSLGSTSDDLRETPLRAQVEAWRRRLQPVRRWVFAGAIAIGSLMGATLFFVTHPANASLAEVTRAVSTAASVAPVAASPASTPTAAAPVAAPSAKEPAHRPAKRAAAKPAAPAQQARRK